MPRVLHVNKYLDRRGGAEEYLFDLVAWQRGQGADVAVWGMADPSRAPEPAVWPHAGDLAPYVALEPPPPGLAAKARAAAHTVWSETARRRLGRVLDAFRPDVVHAHNVYHHLSPSVLRAVSARGVPLVLTLHDYKLACPSYHFLAGGEVCRRCLDGRFFHAVQTRCKGGLAASATVAVEARVHRSLGLYGAAGTLVCPSRFLADQMRTAGVYPDRLVELGYPLDTRALVARSQPGHGVVHVGRLAPEKGVDVLVDALGRLPGVRLDVVGDGPSRSELEAQAARVAPGRVVFHGSRPRAEVRARLATAGVAAVPSRWLENRPIWLLEALGTGLPVVASDLGGLPELVRPEETGLLVPPEDPAALAAALGRVLADPALGVRLGEAGRDLVRTVADPDTHGAALWRRYGLD